MKRTWTSIVDGAIGFRPTVIDYVLWVAIIYVVIATIQLLSTPMPASTGQNVKYDRIHVKPIDADTYEQRLKMFRDIEKINKTLDVEPAN